MIFTLSIIINLCLIFAVWRISKKEPKVLSFTREITNDRQLRGKLDKMYIRSVIAEKMAERAFNMASSSSLGVIALQKALVVPRLMTKQQGKQNELAKNEVDKIFTANGNFDWLRPILSDEDLDILDKAEEDFRKKAQ